MTACKSAAKDKQKTNVRQKAVCIQPHSWEHSSQPVQVQTDASARLRSHIPPKPMRTLPWHISERQKSAYVARKLYGHQTSISSAALKLRASMWIFTLRHFRDLSTVSTGWAQASGT